MNRESPFTSYIGNASNVLNCPFCGDDYLHQMDVEVSIRKEEDGDFDTTRISSKYDVHTYTTPADSIQGRLDRRYRRDFLRIYFRCENCGELHYPLIIFQNKGTTIMKWENE